MAKSSHPCAHTASLFAHTRAPNEAAENPLFHHPVTVHSDGTAFADVVIAPRTSRRRCFQRHQTIMRSISHLLCTIPFTLLLACGTHDSAFDGDGSAAPNLEQDVEHDSAAADPGIVASADVGYGTVFFHEYRGEDGSTAIAISQLAPNTYASTPLHDVMAKHTNLEVFLALVPDEEPPQSYVDAHAAQAAELGRETIDILEAAFDANAPIEKVSQQCKDWITPAKSEDRCFYVNYTGVKNADNKTGLSSLTLSSTKKQTTTGICNDGTHNVQGRLRWAPANTESYNSPGWTPNVPPGGAWIWFGAYVPEPCNVPKGELCVTINQKVKWRVEGKSMTTKSTNTYDLRGAIIDGYETVYPERAGCIFK